MGGFLVPPPLSHTPLPPPLRPPSDPAHILVMADATAHPLYVCPKAGGNCNLVANFQGASIGGQITQAGMWLDETTGTVYIPDYVFPQQIWACPLSGALPCAQVTYTNGPPSDNSNFDPLLVGVSGVYE